MFATRAPQSARRVAAEHAELRSSLGEVQKHFAMGPDNAAVVRAEVLALKPRLLDHFRTEETEGFFADIVEKDARFAPEAARLGGEHAAMIGEFDEIASLLDDAAGWGEADRRFHEFARWLMRHESDENQLLQRAYGEDIGSKD